jgi:hypothetical protein
MQHNQAVNTTHESQAEVITTETNKLSVTIGWGSKHHRETREQEPITYSFNTQEELNAFMLGADESNGYMDYIVMNGDPYTLDPAQWSQG